jgi:hypothetical protein
MDETIPHIRYRRISMSEARQNAALLEAAASHTGPLPGALRLAMLRSARSVLTVVGGAGRRH